MVTMFEWDIGGWKSAARFEENLVWYSISENKCPIIFYRILPCLGFQVFEPKHSDRNRSSNIGILSISLWWKKPRRSFWREMISIIETNNYHTLLSLVWLWTLYKVEKNVIHEKFWRFVCFWSVRLISEYKYRGTRRKSSGKTLQFFEKNIILNNEDTFSIVENYRKVQVFINFLEKTGTR